MPNAIMPAYVVHAQLADGQVLESRIGARHVFGAVQFIQDEAAKNAWTVVALHVRPFEDGDVVEAVEVAQVKQ